MNREKEIVKTSVVGILGNVLLVGGKIVVGLLAASISIVLDAVNNMTDVLSSVVTIVGTKLSAKKPDKKHPYGHGRLEFVTASLIGMIIFAAGFMAIYESILNLIAKEEPTYSFSSFIIISVAVLVKIALGLFYRKKGKAISSDALKASGTDALMDSILSFGTLVGAVVSYTTNVHLEGYIGIVIGLLILKSAIDVLRESISKIIGERTDSDLANEMTEEIAKDPRVYGVYDLIINNYGTDRNIGSVHVEVADDMCAKEIQLLEREIAYLCYEKYHTVMTVGVYAKSGESEEEKEIKKKVLTVVSQHPEIIQTHGFYVDFTRKIISLDIVVTFDCKTPELTQKTVCEKVALLFPDYTPQVIVDMDFALS